MTDIKIQDRLYLSQAEDIYVDHSKLVQHQIDALRFLYTHYKKKRSGVILNDPSGYGKTVVAVLFLQALRQRLTAPALVLCRAAELQHWRRHFHSWTSVDDIIYESPNPYVKKSIFVNTRQHLAALARRTWSIAVVDDELPRELQADFKIYITSDDMKDNLYTFSSIHQWLYPKEEFDINFFTANANDPLDVDKKSVLLDFFFEEIVFRSRNFTPFKKPETQTSLAIEPPRISLKNKDATGTKIKRSKARIEAETNNAAKVARIEPLERNATITSKDYYKTMDVESFIKNEPPIAANEELVEFQNRSDTNQVDITNDSVNGNVAANEVCTADYQNAINEIVNNENDSIKEDKHNVSDDISDTGKGMKDNDSIQNVVNDGDSNIVCNNKDVVSVLEENKADTIRDVVNSGPKDLEAKLIELEEKTLNKFKGSLLDSIF